MKEVWKDVYFVDKGITYDYRGLYQASNLGRIKSLERWFDKNHHYRERILKPTNDGYGYLQFNLCKDKKNKIVKVHKVIANVFIPNLENKPCINHKNGIKTDNKVCNLEWCTYSENTKHSFQNGLQKIKYGKEHHNSKQVLQYDLEGNYIKTWDCIKDIEREMGIWGCHISRCCKGKLNKTGGYHWKYKDTN